MQEQYLDKNENAEGYFDNTKTKLLDLIPLKLRGGDLLEIGAASGNTLIYAKKNGYAENIYGVELCDIKNSNQENKLLSDFIIGNIEEIELPYNKESFDVILCGDVLEHLVDPYKIVNTLRKYLKKDGVFISSIPNIRKLSILKTIFVNGDFKYADHGILDKTHLRFFTKKNMINLFEDNGYTVINIIPSDTCNVKRYLKRLRFIRLFKCLLSAIFKEFFTIQYYLVAKKNIEHTD